MAARCFTRRRDLPEKWWVRLSFCSSSLPMVPITVTCKKNTNATTSCLLSFSVFGFRFASVSSLGSVPFLCLISSLSQVAGKEGERARGRLAPVEAELRGDEGENEDGRAFTIWQLVQEQGLLGLSRGQKLPLLRSVEGEEEDSGGCRCGEELVVLLLLVAAMVEGRGRRFCGGAVRRELCL
jgi:hypothetical protein